MLASNGASTLDRPRTPEQPVSTNSCPGTSTDRDACIPGGTFAALPSGERTIELFMSRKRERTGAEGAGQTAPWCERRLSGSRLSDTSVRAANAKSAILAPVHDSGRGLATWYSYPIEHTPSGVDTRGGVDDAVEQHRSAQVRLIGLLFRFMHALAGGAEHGDTYKR